MCLGGLPLFCAYLYWLSTEEIREFQGENENSPRRAEIKVRKNEMKLRKKQIKVPKNFFVPRWRIRNPSEEIFDFLEGKLTISD